MEEFTWTPKRIAAREYLIQARGNVALAAELSQKGPVSVSHAYLSELRYAKKYRAFREEYQRRTGELLNALEVNTEYVVKGLVELTRPDMPPSTRRQALRDLGQHLGMWAPRSKGVEEQEKTSERVMKAIEDESDPQRKKAIIQALETLADMLE